jgi:uncharacterized membrane protein
MKARCVATCCSIFIILLVMLLPFYTAFCQDYVEYLVQVNSDGSALWKITSFSGVNASVDTLDGFQSKVSSLVDSADNQTQRDMSVDYSSLQINTNISAESKITEYSFLWQNFSTIQGNQIVFGDVFQVKGFFNLLFGDAALQIRYPSTFSIKSVIPAPYHRDDSAKTLDWARTEDLTNSKAIIILTATPSKDNSSQNEWQLYAIIATLVVVGATLSLVGFFMLKRQKHSQLTSKVIPIETNELETEEDKILKLLKSSNGGLRQSAIVEQCRFSKAKTSQLLAILEENGSITRYKKGRDKIVNLTERVKSE